MKEGTCYIIGNIVKQETKEEITNMLKELIEIELFSTFYVGYNNDFGKLVYSILVDFRAKFSYLKVFTNLTMPAPLLHAEILHVEFLPPLNKKRLKILQDLYNSQMLDDCKIILCGIKKDNSKIYKQYKKAVELNKQIILI